VSRICVSIDTNRVVTWSSNTVAMATLNPGSGSISIGNGTGGHGTMTATTGAFTSITTNGSTPLNIAANASISGNLEIGGNATFDSPSTFGDLATFQQGANMQGEVTGPSFAAGQMIATNTVTPTNSFAGTLVDFSRTYWTTNLGGNLTFTGIANATAGERNTDIITILPGGSDRIISVPASWHIARGGNMVVSNAFHHSDFIFTCMPGASTNVEERDYP
jgi:hypothetical protein